MPREGALLGMLNERREPNYIVFFEEEMLGAPSSQYLFFAHRESIKMAYLAELFKAATLSHACLDKIVES